VIWGYRLILGREIESEKVIQQHISYFRDVDSFADGLFRSAEFTQSARCCEIVARTQQLNRFVEKHVANLDPQSTLSRDAVIWAFRLILGREPESEKVIQHYMSFFMDVDSLANGFFRSAEFVQSARCREIVDRAQNIISEHFDNRGCSSTFNGHIVVIGNCQARPIAQLIQANTGCALPYASITRARFIKQLESRETNTIKILEYADLIFVHADHDTISLLGNVLPSSMTKLRLIPRITFPAFHPDIDYIYDSGGKHITGPVGDYQSTIAFKAWKMGYDVAQAVGLFRDDIFAHLGFYEYWEPAMDALKKEGRETNLPLDTLIQKWGKSAVWMYSMNHPCFSVLADVTRAILQREQIPCIDAGTAERFAYDNLKDNAVWPIYPALAAKLGVESQPLFKPPKALASYPVRYMDLQSFVEASFEAYSHYKPDALSCARLETARYKSLDQYLAATKAGRMVSSPSPSVVPPVAAPASVNPYANLADYHFWRRAIERISIPDVDPVVDTTFTLTLTDKIATAGSCFAQHISNTLTKTGFNYFVSETDASLSAEVALRRNFGVFSARYGNIYTARQLLQLFDRAYGKFTPTETHWLRADGRLVDPFRPQIEPDGFATLAELTASRISHFAAVRRLFEQLDVFVFTLGLTESWLSMTDGAVFPLAPGVAGGTMDMNRYSFKNFSVTEVVSDMQQFIARLRSINPRCRLIITVSPVPLIATYENRHVLVSTTFSKSVLRAAAEEICTKDTTCVYFPSYEIITGAYTKGSYFAEDLRSVTPEGVNHVMRLFLKHYAPATALGSTRSDLLQEIEGLKEVVCDEEAIDRAG
jgi:hypothetical protein